MAEDTGATGLSASGIRMPGFFGYLAWSGTILLPLFGLLTALFFW